MEQREPVNGTAVYMKLANNSPRKDREVFDDYTTADDFGFTKTVVPVSLAEYGDDRLVSRSQAKRLMSGLDQFKTVIFDFKDVETIGQAFADEVFRVFHNHNPDVVVKHSNANPQVRQKINRVTGKK